MDAAVENGLNDLQKSIKERKTEQLDKRNRERQEQINAKHELNKQNLSESESVDYFHESFRKHVQEIEENLSNLKPTTNRIQLTKDMQKILEDWLHVQNYLTASTFFLSNYTVQACQTILNDLKARIEATKDTLLAKKKFNFRSKVDASSSKGVTTVDAAPKKTVSLPTSSDKATDFQWTLQNRHHEEIELTSTETNNKDITVSTLDSCLLRVYGYPGSIQLSHLTNCVILCGPISRSLFADNCTNCQFVVGCQQLRLHTSHHCDLYIHVTSRAIIEDCNNINVAPYNFKYANIDDDFVKAGLDMTINNWDNVADFNWLSKDVQSPNWRQIDTDQRISCWNEFLNEFRQKILST